MKSTLLKREIGLMKKIIFLILMLNFHSYTLGGTLDHFGADATKKILSGNHFEAPHSSSFDEVFTIFFAEILAQTLVYGGIESFRRVHGSSRYENNRKSGDPLLPFCRVSLAYQSVKSDIDAVDSRFEAGYGPVAGQFRFTRYDEITPDDRLDMKTAHFLYRMSMSRFFEIDFGIGGIHLKDEHSHTGTSFTIPILIYPVKYFGLEFRPTYSNIDDNSLEDYDVGLYFHVLYMTLQAGYRSVSTENESLEGPYIGFSIIL